MAGRRAAGGATYMYMAGRGRARAVMAAKARRAQMLMVVLTCATLALVCAAAGAHSGGGRATRVGVGRSSGGSVGEPPAAAAAAAAAGCQLAVADSMAQVLRSWAPPSGAPNALKLSLARGESEGIQLVLLGSCTVARVEAKLAPSPPPPHAQHETTTAHHSDAHSDTAGTQGSAESSGPTVRIYPVGYVPPGPCPSSAWGGNSSTAKCPSAQPFKCRCD